MNKRGVEYGMPVCVYSKPEDLWGYDVFYEIVGERFQLGFPYAFYVFHGRYDVPVKGNDGARQWESEEVYSFLIGALCKVSGDYEAQKPERGFLFPAFRNRSADCGRIDIYRDYAEVGDDLKNNRLQGFIL